jgi:hypothetical protein
MKGWWWFAGVNGNNIIEWLPFFDNEVVWLPLFSWIIGLVIVIIRNFFTVSFEFTYFLGELINILAAAGAGVYIYKILKNIFGYSGSKGILGIIILLTHGLWLAYSSQAMTESLCIFFMIGFLYHLTLAYFKEEFVVNYLLATVFIILSSFLRYEAWIYTIGIIFIILLISMYQRNGRANANDLRELKLENKFLIGLLVIAIAVPIIWMLHTYVNTGTFIRTINYISDETIGNTWLVNTKGDLINVIYVLLINLTLASILWIIIPYFYIKRYKQVKKEMIITDKKEFYLFLQLLVILLLFGLNAVLMFIGSNPAWPRYFLYFVPFIAIIGPLMYNQEGKRTKNMIKGLVLVNIMVGIIIIYTLNAMHIELVNQIPEYIVP